MPDHVIGQRGGRDLVAVEASIDTTAAGLERLGRAVAVLGVQVSSVLTPRYPAGRGVSATLMLVLPADLEADARELLRPCDWRPAPRGHTSVRGVLMPAATWGELRDAVEALSAGPTVTWLPCGHPAALLTFDAVASVYRCPGCERQRRELEEAPSRDAHQRQPWTPVEAP